MADCLRCGHSWIPRLNKEPRICPKCKSYKWNMKKGRFREFMYEKTEEHSLNVGRPTTQFYIGYIWDRKDQYGFVKDWWDELDKNSNHMLGKIYPMYRDIRDHEDYIRMKNLNWLSENRSDIVDELLTQSKKQVREYLLNVNINFNSD